MDFNVKEKITQFVPPSPSVTKFSLKQVKSKFWSSLEDHKSYGTAGTLEVRLATRKKEVKKAQRLRYKVFYKEMSAIPDATTKLKRRDIDAYDKFCDHLILLDHKAKPKVVGTYRMLTQDVAARHGGFYSQNEYDIAPLLAAKSATQNFLELGRSCVLNTHRSKRSIELLWHGLWTYIRANNIDVMIGCASFAGIDPKQHALALSYLHHCHKAPPEWSVRAHNHLHVDMNMIDKKEIDMRRALKTMPPLIKGYLRLGAIFGDGAVIDHQFGTTDVMVIMPVASIDKRYFSHFGTPHETKSRLTKAKNAVLN